MSDGKYCLKNGTKDNANNGRIPPSCPFLALMTPFPDIAFINEKATGCTNEKP